MGRLMNLFTGVIHDVFGICRKTDVVAGMPTHPQSVSEAARFLFARLAWCVGAGPVTIQWCHAVSVPGAAHSRKPKSLRLSLPRYRRQSRRGPRASSGIF